MLRIVLAAVLVLVVLGMAFSWKVLLALGGAIVAAGTGLLYKYQDRLLYYPQIPSREYMATPDVELLIEGRPFAATYEDLNIVTQDGVRLHAWFIRHPAVSAAAVPTVLFFHGNAGNISHRIPNAVEMVYHLKCNVVLLEYRGYGGSTGEPSMRGLQLDAEAALAHVLARPDVDPSRLLLFGRSLGGAVAVHLAAKHSDKLRGVILENTFTSIPEMVDRVMPALKVFKPLVRSTWRSVELMPRIRVPLLFLSGDRDELVPPAMMRRLYERATGTAHRTLEVVPGGTHNETWRVPGYYVALQRFVQQCCS